MLVHSLAVYPLDCMAYGELHSLPCPASGEGVSSLGEDHNPKFELWFLLYGYVMWSGNMLAGYSVSAISSLILE